MEELGEGKVKYTTIPYSELALYLGIAGKTGRIVQMRKNWAVVRLNGKTYEGLSSELVDISDRQK